MKRGPFVRVAIALSAAAAVLVVSEIALRWLLPLSVFFPPYRQGLANEFTAAGMFRSLPDDGLRFGLVPDHAATIGGITYRHNSLGLRGPEVASKSANAVRLLVVGDSYTYGWGVTESQSIPGQLARLMREDLAPRDLEVVNAGVPAYDSTQELHLIRALVPRLAPDAILLVCQTNDITCVDFVYMEELHAFFTCDLPLDYTIKRSLRNSRLYHLVRRAHTWWRQTRDFEWCAEGEWPRTRASLTAIVDECRARGLPLAVLNLPNFQIGSSIYFSSLGPPGFSRQSQWIDDLCQALGVPVIDLLPTIRHRVEVERQPVEDLYVDRVNDHHLNAAGCELVASVVASALRSSGFLRRP